jgi:Tryptophan dimethylallyltransferase
MSTSTPSMLYFPLVLQALFFSLLRIVVRLSQCVARTFYKVRKHGSAGHPPITSDPIQSPHSTENRLAFWNASAGNALRTLLDWVSYPQYLRAKYDAFFAAYIIPRLGPSPHMIDPSRLQSQLQDDHTPLEFSCVLESDTCGKVQCYAEPLNPVDGSSTPREKWMATLHNMLVAGGVRDADLSWCETCADTLTIEPPSVLPASEDIHIQFAMGTPTIILVV